MCSELKLISVSAVTAQEPDLLMFAGRHHQCALGALGREADAAVKANVVFIINVMLLSLNIC